MRPTTMLYGAALALALSAGGAAAEDLGPRVRAAKESIQAFAAGLKRELKAGLEAGGPVEAITVCNERAPAIAAEQSAAAGLGLRRTSLRLRNPANAPDAWERAVLEDFERRRARGEDPASLVRYEVVESGSLREFRLMKAIPTGQLCLACHGASIAPEVAARLDALYPEDRARGFAVGDLRGAFSVRQPM
jgi:hypothetical protein